MQVKIFDRSGNIYKNLDRCFIDTISVKNGGSIRTQQFESIIGMYATFELETRLLNSGYDNRFAIGIVGDYSLNSDGTYSYKILDIMRDLERGDLTGYETGSGTIATLTGNILARYSTSNSGIDIFFSVSISPAIAGTYYYTAKKNCYDAFQELIKQIPSVNTYMINFVDKGVTSSLSIQFGSTGNSYNLYQGKNTFDDRFITSLSYTLSRETLANDVYYFNSAGTYVGNVNDATSISTYGRKVKEYRADTNDGSEVLKAQQFLDKYKNPYPIINELRINDIGLLTRLYVGDTIKVMSEGIRNDVFVNNSFLIQDIVYNGASNDFNLIIGDIINNKYLKL